MDVGRPPQKKRALTDSLKVAATYSPTTCSTIGVAELNDPVRNGKGWDLSAITTLIISLKLRVESLVLSEVRQLQVVS